ncbi:MAG: 4-(cytidine 5'-diphospho)-2-C-methyl-D-erythritol kinase [Bacillota bacterium]|nr:4-(cytidine 5'-diphospho)-2-C-methyl-D-erythritol kinase [Bacillota bacterium]
MNRIDMKAWAKVNLFLNVVGKRPDGFHELEMFNATIGLCDDVNIERVDNQNGVTVTSNDKFLENGNNLVTRVANELLKRYAPDAGVRITIDKRIPAGAGLGGNSADAAAVIHGLDRLFGWNLNPIEKAAFALKHGADIPYCLQGGTAAVYGIGERIKPISVDLSGWSVLVVHPNIFTSTEQVFAAWDAGGFPQVPFAPFLKCAEAGDIVGMVANMKNALEPATFSIAPEVAAWKTKISRELGHEGVVMTGSGSTILKVFVNNSARITRFLDENKDNSRVFVEKFVNKE